jgi:hypothetical protein
VISRTPRYVRWSLFAVVSALPLALIAPWQAQAGPGSAVPANIPARAIGAVPMTGVPAAASEMPMDDPADAVAGAPADPNVPEPDPAIKGKNNERHRMLQEVDNAGGGKNPNPNCTLIVPNAPLTAQGLATPYQLVATNRRKGPCHENNINQSAFVEATIIDPATGALAIYRPLVIDQGTQAGAPPVVPNLTPGSVVGLWFGFQGTTLRLAGASGGCVNGLPGSPFGQFAYCGAPEFFKAANAAISAGKLKVPALGMARDNQPCPSTRDFAVVDQDQSDNLTTKYLALANGRTAQDTPANVAALPARRLLKNASDNGLLTGFIDPALGCAPFTAPDITAGGTPAPSLALNELQAAATKTTPPALIPPNDPMAQVNGRVSMAKVNLYRAGVNQPPINPAVDTARTYCGNLATIAPARLRLDRPLFINAPSPDPAAAKNLFTFLVQRLKASFTDLACTPVRKKR